VLRGIFVPMVEEVTGGWGKFHNEEFPNFCPSLRTTMIKIRMKWTRYIKHMREKKYHNCFGRKPLRIGSLGTPRRRWEDNIKIGLKEMGWEDQ
jgi:hypothetical protein